MTQTQPSNPEPTAAQLAARLLYLHQQAKTLVEEIDKIKAACETRFSAGTLAAKTDSQVLFSDQSTQNIRLARVLGGSYFKVKEEAKEVWAKRRKELENQFLTGGLAEMAEKAASWTAKVVK